jgi:hypothetical protein
MTERSLQLTYRKGGLSAAYLHLSHATGEKSAKTVASPDGLVIVDYGATGRAVGVEITATGAVPLPCKPRALLHAERFEVLDLELCDHLELLPANPISPFCNRHIHPTVARFARQETNEIDWMRWLVALGWCPRRRYRCVVNSLRFCNPSPISAASLGVKVSAPVAARIAC